MKKILVIGLSHILGGVETYIYNVTRFIDKNKYYFDYLIIGEEKSVFENETNKLFDDQKNHFYYCPNLKKHYIKGKKWLKNFSENHKYDYVYLNTCTSAKYQYCSYLLKNGSKLISHSHNGSGNSKINNAVFRPIITKKSWYKLACSDLAGKWLFGDNCSDFTIIPNGVDVDRFKFSETNRKAIRKKYNISNKEIIIGHVGRFDKQKNHYYFIELAKSLPNNYIFMLIGDGSTKSELVVLIKNNNLDDRFIIIPSKDDIEKYYSAMDLFVMPSLYEGLPIVSVEAQTNGLSCIFSDNVSKQSNLSNHCVFLPLQDVKKWVEQIRNSSHKRFDGEEEICKRKFDIKSTVKMIESIIDSDKEEKEYEK